MEKTKLQSLLKDKKEKKHPEIMNINIQKIPTDYHRYISTAATAIGKSIKDFTIEYLAAESEKILKMSYDDFVDTFEEYNNQE